VVGGFLRVPMDLSFILGKREARQGKQDG